MYAVIFSSGVRFSVGKRMSGGIGPIVERYRAYINAYTVSDATIPVYSTGCSVYAKFRGSFDGPPDFVAVMFTYNLSFSLKIRVYWQKITTFTSGNG